MGPCPGDVNPLQYLSNRSCPFWPAGAKRPSQYRGLALPFRPAGESVLHSTKVQSFRTGPQGKASFAVPGSSPSVPGRSSERPSQYWGPCRPIPVSHFLSGIAIPRPIFGLSMVLASALEFPRGYPKTQDFRYFGSHILQVSSRVPRLREDPRLIPNYVYIFNG